MSSKWTFARVIPTPENFSTFLDAGFHHRATRKMTQHQRQSDEASLTIVHHQTAFLGFVEIHDLKPWSRFCTVKDLFLSEGLIQGMTSASINSVTDPLRGQRR